jgi:hypothetical protein
MSNPFKRSYLNLWNSLGNKKFQIAQTESQLTFSMVTNTPLEMKDGNRTVSDTISLLQRVEPAHSAIESVVLRVSGVESNVYSLNNRVASRLESNVDSVILRVSTNESQMLSLNSRVASRLESNVDSVILRVSTNESQVLSLNSQVASRLESNVDSVILRVSANESGISSLNSRVASRLESNVDSVILRVSMNESELSSLTSRVASRLESNVDSVITRVSEVQSGITSLSGRISIVESNINSVVVRNESGYISIDSTSISGLPTPNQWAGGVLASNGNIYFVPQHSQFVLVVDSVTNTIVTQIDTRDVSQNKWRNGVLASNGKIYCIPFYATYVLIIDPTTNTIDTTSITGLASNIYKWDGGVLGADGKIYGIPRDSTSVLIIDPVTNTADTTSITGLSGSTKYGGGVLHSDGRIYAFPLTATNVLIIDPTSPTTSISGVTLSSASYNDSTRIMTYDGTTLVGSVNIGDNILITTTTTNYTGYVQSITNTTITFINALGADITTGQITTLQKTRKADITSIRGLSTLATKWYGGGSMSDGKIYGIPFNANSVLIVDPVSASSSIAGTIDSAQYDNTTRILTCPGATFTTSLSIGDNILIQTNTSAGGYTGYVQSITDDTTLTLLYALGANITTGQVTSLQKNRRADVTTISGLGSTSTQKWAGGKIASDGKFYGIPCGVTRGLILDPSNSTTTISGFTLSNASYNDTTLTLTCPGASLTSSVSIGDNIIIQTNTSAGTYVGYVQTVTNTTLTFIYALGATITTGQITALQKTRKADITRIQGIPLSPGNSGGSGGSGGSYLEGVLGSNGKIYASAFNADNILIIDPSSSLSTISGVTVGTTSYTNSSRTLTCPGASFLSAGLSVGDNIVITTTTNSYTGYLQSVSSNQTLVFVYALGLNLASGTITNIQKTRVADVTTIPIAVGDNKYAGGVLAPNGKIYMAPLGANRVLIIDPTTNSIDTTSIAGFSTGGNKWNIPVLAPNGKIYCPPYSATSVLIIDPVTNTADANIITGLTGTYSGSVLAPNGKIYGIPHSATNVLIIDPVTNTADTTLKGLPGSAKWQGGVLAPNGKIYCIPQESTSVLIIDPESPVSAIPGVIASTASYTDSTKLFTCPGASFLTSVTIGDNILITTASASYIGYVQSISSNTQLTFIYALGLNLAVGVITGIQKTRKVDLTTITGPELSGSSKWVGGVLAPNGKIYGIPHSSSSVLIIDPITNTIDTTTITGLSGNLKWYGGVLGFDGKIYGMPMYTNQILVIDPVTNSATTVTNGSAGVEFTNGGVGVLGPNGEIYTVPRDAPNVLIIDINSGVKTTSSNIATFLESNVNSVITRVSKVESGITSFNSRVASRLESNVDSVILRVSVVESGILSLNSRVASRLESNVNSVILRVSINESGVLSLNSRVTSRLDSNVDSVILRVSANESGVLSLNSRVASRLESNVDSVVLRVSANESGILSFNSRVASRLESNVDSVVLRVSANESGVLSLNSRVFGFESNVDSVVVRVSTVNSEISDVKTTIFTIFDGSPTNIGYSTLQIINAELLLDNTEYNNVALESRLYYLERVVSRLTMYPQ